MDIANRFKSWIADAGRPTPLGTWLMSAAPSTAEAMGYCGFDFLVVDMEHVPIEVSDLANILRAIGCTPADAVVRLAWNDQVLVKRVLDAGAQTVMLPFVQTAEEARPPPPTPAIRRRAFAASPPFIAARGSAASRTISRRRMARSVPSSSSRRRKPSSGCRKSRRSRGSMRCSSGPGDLSAAMGHIGNIAHPEVQALIEKAAKDARAAGKPIGIVGPNPDMVRRFIGYGYNYAAIASDIAMMTGRANDWLADLKGTQPVVAASQAAY